MYPAVGPTHGRFSVAVYASDALTAAGIAAVLGGCAWIDVLPSTQRSESADVVVLAAQSITQDFLDTLRALGGWRPAGLVVVLDDDDAVDMMAEHDLNVLSRTDIDARVLQEAVLRADRTVGEKLLGHLTRVGANLTSLRTNVRGLHAREVDVLRLLASGQSAREIADNLNYSERTIKNIVHAVITRLQLRNRTEAVAYALRAGII
jgi:DNA-binding NarL/FixJ family response regulator